MKSKYLSLTIYFFIFLIPYTILSIRMVVISYILKIKLQKLCVLLKLKISTTSK